MFEMGQEDAVLQVELGRRGGRKLYGKNKIGSNRLFLVGSSVLQLK